MGHEKEDTCISWTTYGEPPVYTPLCLHRCRWLLCTYTLPHQMDRAYGSPASGHLAYWSSCTWLHLRCPFCFCTMLLWANKGEKVELCKYIFLGKDFGKQFKCWLNNIIIIRLILLLLIIIKISGWSRL